MKIKPNIVEEVIILSEFEDLIGKRASITYKPIRDGEDQVAEGEIIDVQWVEWNSTLRVPRFEHYQRITINLAKPGERGTHTLSSASEDVTILD